MPVLSLGGCMRRRQFITLLGGATAWSFASQAQQRKSPEIGFLSSFTQTQSVPAIAAFRRGLNESGLVEGQGLPHSLRVQLSIPFASFQRLAD